MSQFYSSFFLLSGEYNIDGCRSESNGILTPGQACLSVSVKRFWFSLASFRKRLCRPRPVDMNLAPTGVGLTVLVLHAEIFVFHSSPLRVLSFVSLLLCSGCISFFKLR